MRYKYVYFHESAAVCMSRRERKVFLCFRLFIDGYYTYNAISNEKFSKWKTRIGKLCSLSEKFIQHAQKKTEKI